MSEPIDQAEAERHRVRAGRHHEEAASRPAAHAGDLMVLEQPHRFAQQGATHALALNQLRLRPHQLPRLHARSHDGLGDVARHDLGTLALTGLGEYHRIGQELTSGAPAPEKLSLRLQVLVHPVPGQSRVTGHHGLGDHGVCVPRLLLDAAAQALPVLRVELRHPVEHVDEQFEARVATDRGHQRVELPGIASGVHRRVLGKVSQRRQVVLVRALHR